ncbi:MAG: hypothetical protein Q9192_007224 [Flavoplaca navasiana]
MSHRRNAIRPDDVENLLGNQNDSVPNPKNHTIQRLSLERRVFPRKRARSNEDYGIAITSKARPSAKISQPSGVTPLTIPIPSVQQAINYTNDPSTVPDCQSNPSVQERQVGKRKRASISYEEDYYESQRVFFDIMHPSELKLKDKDMDEQKLATMQNDFMREEVRLRSLLAHNPQVNEVQQGSLQGPQLKGGLSSTCRGYQVDLNNGQILAKSDTSTSTSTTSSSSTTAAPLTSASSTTTPTADAPALPSPTTTPSSGLSGGAKAGIAIGAVAGVAIIAGLAFLLFRERKKRKALGQSEKQPPGSYNNGYYGNTGNPNVQQQQQQQQQQPLQPQMPPQELGAYDRNEHKYRFHSELGDGQGRPSELHS